MKMASSHTSLPHSVWRLVIKVEAGPSGSDIKPGNALPLNNIPVGTLIHNVELKPGKGGQLARSAGTYVQLVGRDRGHAILRLASGEVRLVRSECMASIGAVSNSDQQNIKIGKAGRSRWLGSVRMFVAWL